MGLAIMRSMVSTVALALSAALVIHAQFAAADWNVNVGSNINSAPVVVNDPLLDFGAAYVSDYAQHRIVECFYNGTCRDFVQKGSGGLKWPWGIEFGHHDNGRAQNTGWDDRDKMYVASEGTNSIILYNAANGILKKSPFAQVPGTPRAVKYFRQSIFVTSYHKHCVYRFNARTGSPQGKFTHGDPPCSGRWTSNSIHSVAMASAATFTSQAKTPSSSMSATVAPSLTSGARTFD